MRKIPALIAAALIASGSHATEVAPEPPPAPPGPVVILTGRALDGAGAVLRGARIGVVNGKISSLAAPVTAPVIDLRGYTVLPGWIDTHVHLELHFDRTGRIATEKESPEEGAIAMADAAWRTLMAGFTTIQSVGDPNNAALRDSIRDHGFPGPRLLTSLAPIEGPLTQTPDELRAMVRERKAQGADLVKIFASSSQRVGATPTLTEEQLRILCGEAKAIGLRSMVHVYRSQAAAAARAGCREIEHLTYATQQDIDEVVRAGAFISPQVGLVVQNYLENKARYLGVGNYTEEGMAIMKRDLWRTMPSARWRYTPPARKSCFQPMRPPALTAVMPRNSLAASNIADNRRWPLWCRRIPLPPIRSAWRIGSAGWRRDMRPTSLRSMAIPSPT